MIGGSLVIAFVSLWVVLTVLMQCIHLLGRRKRFPSFYCLPVWKLFAPDPIVFDLILIAKGEFRDGSGFNWTQLHRPMRSCSWSFLWNPYQYEERAIFRILQKLMVITGDSGVAAAGMTSEYEAVVKYVNGHCSPKVYCFRFGIVCREALLVDSPRLLFVSQSHLLEL